VRKLGYGAGGWRVEKHARFVDDLAGEGRADIVGFGDAGVWVALGNGDGTFQDPQFVVPNFGYEAGEWRVDKHPRFLADLTGEGQTERASCREAGVWVAVGDGDGTIQERQFGVPSFGYEAGGWRA